MGIENRTLEIFPDLSRGETLEALLRDRVKIAVVLKLAAGKPDAEPIEKPDILGQ